MASNPLERMRKAEHARISRWFSEDDLGLVFFDFSNVARYISQSEYGEWHRQATEQVDRLLKSWERVPGETMALVIGTGFSLAVIPASDNGWTTPFPLFVLIPALFCFWPFFRMAQWRLAQARLRRSIIVQLSHRSPVLIDAKLKRPRVNLFMMMFEGCLMIFLIFIVAMQIVRPDPNDPALIIALLASYALILPLHWAARRVDRVHTRPLKEWWRL